MQELCILAHMHVLLLLLLSRKTESLILFNPQMVYLVSQCFMLLKQGIIFVTAFLAARAECHGQEHCSWCWLTPAHHAILAGWGRYGLLDLPNPAKRQKVGGIWLYVFCDSWLISAATARGALVRMHFSQHSTLSTVCKKAMWLKTASVLSGKQRPDGTPGILKASQAGIWRMGQHMGKPPE